MRHKFDIADELGDGYITEKHSGQRWHREHFRVLYADTDKAGVVYHANYLKYFEIGRAGMIRASGRSYKDIEKLGFFHPIVDLRVQFEAHADYDDLLSVYSRPRYIAPVKFSYDYFVRDDERSQILVYGYTEHCCIDRNHKVMQVDPVTVAIFHDFDVEMQLKNGNGLVAERPSDPPRVEERPSANEPTS
ncbi:MAG: acyl-CoA thioesterase [Deltaproteobacteria bacterium]|nr:acyl-CoA thioesterase [Deltaproteobacteria bacterium]